MTLMKSILGTAAALALTAGAALAEPAVIFDLGGKFDKSFNESAYNGATRWAEETGNTFAEIELSSEAQREQAVRRFAEAGNSPVIMTGFSFGSILGDIAADYPDTEFVIIDSIVEQPNVTSVVFNEHEGSYLVGMMAAMASQTGTVSFVGGMDVPLIRRFGCGFAEGAKAVNPDITVISNMTGTDPSAWNDPVKGSELTLSQISQGSDVVFAAAGGTGVGVLQTAADEGILSIGVDSNQNYLHPGQVLTSMLKRVDNAVYDAMSDDGGLTPGVNVMSVANEGVGYALDDDNADLVTPEMIAAVDDASARMADGSLVVHDYSSDESCPSVDF